MLVKCPGQDMQSWGPDAVFDVECPSCGAAVELFKDEVKRSCPSCGTRVFNDRIDLGCAEWCPSAAQCVGPNAPELTDEQREALRRAVEHESRGEDEQESVDR